MTNRLLWTLAQRGGLEALARRSLRGSVLVLVYHGVVSRRHEDDAYTYRNTVSRDEFDYQLGVINRLFRPIGLADWLAAKQGTASLPERAVMVTFDDGYRNNLTNAAPLLQRHGIPALINLATGYVGSERPLWTEEVVQCVAGWPRPMIPLPGEERPVPCPADAAARRRLAHRVREQCKQIPDLDRRAYIEMLRQHSVEQPRGDDGNERLAFLDWEEVRELCRRGFDIGSHTVDHPILSRVSAEELAYQLSASRQIIEQETGRACSCLAYPNGAPADSTPAVARAAMRAGYALALTVTNRWHRGGSGPFTVGRLALAGHLPREAFDSRISAVRERFHRVNGSAFVANGVDVRPPASTERVGGGPVTALEVRLLTRFDDLEALAGEWDRLWRSNPTAEIFGKFSWIRAWWRAYGDGCSLSAPAVFENGRLIGLLPLALQGRTWRLLGTPGADYRDVLAEEGRAEEVVTATLRAVAALVRPSQRCELENFSESSILARCLPSVPPAVLSRLQFRPSSPCPTVLLGSRGPEAVAAILGKKSLRRHTSKLRRMGTLTFRHVSDRAEIRRLLPGFFHTHVLRRAMAGQASSLLKPEARTFVEALVEELDPDCELRFGVLELDGKPIAYHFGLESRGKLLWYKPAFDVGYWDFSPGEVMIGHLLEYARDRRLDEFDFTRGGEAAKHRFADAVRWTYLLQIYPPDAHGWLLHRVDDLKEWVKTRRPPLYAAVKKAVERAASERKHAVDRLKRHGVGGVTRKLALQMWRRIVFARDEVLVYVSGPTAPGRAGFGEFPPDSVTYKGSLADLAELAVAHPEYIDRQGLERAGRRLRSGDRVYVTRCGGQVAHVHWAGLRTEVAPTEVGARLRIPLETPEVLAYDAWTAPQFRGRGLHRLVMQVVLAETRASGLRQWCYCIAANTASRRAIEANGFRRAYRLVRLRLFGRAWQWVEDLRHEQTLPGIRRETSTHEPVVGA